MLSTLATIWLLHIVATVTPGANTLLVSQLAAGNRGPGALFAAIGVAVGSVSWAALAVLGVGIVFNAFPVLRLSLQVIGGLYLLYVAVRLWLSGSLGPTIGTDSVSPMVAFRLGLLTNFTNPKAALFFGSVFSACFPVNPDPALLVAAVALVFVNSLGWYVLLAHVFSREAVRFAYLRKRRAAGKVAGIVLGTLGFRVLLMSFREARS
jgi:threonine/homoserine/homoserine lactone efflux protein